MKLLTKQQLAEIRERHDKDKEIEFFSVGGMYETNKDKALHLAHIHRGKLLHYIQLGRGGYPCTWGLDEIIKQEPES